MALWIRFLFTMLGVIGLALAVYLLLYAGPIAWANIDILTGGARIQARYRDLADFIGVAATFGSLVLLIAIGLIAWLLVKLWRAELKAERDASAR